MDNVYVLVEGYAYPGPNDSYIASPTTSLIETNDKKILVDPGTNRGKVLKALNDRKIKLRDIDFIFLSHYHPDHFLNIRLFPELDMYDGTTLWRNDEEYTHKKYIPGTAIEILPTPGHSSEHASLLVKTAEGIVCIAQDVFWWEDGKQQTDTEKALLTLEDPFATDRDSLIASRKKVLERADFIIPGHGKMFKNPRK